MTNTRHAILIAGMHRSGTSALARVVNMLGAEIGADLMPAAPANPRGYWEDKATVTLNEELLASFGLSWNDPAPLPDDWRTASWLPEWRERLAAHLQSTFPTAPLFVIKDPRICRLLPVWLDMLSEAEITPHVILAVRTPTEVTGSLAHRDGMTPSRANVLWLRHVLEAEAASRGVRRAFVTFREFLSDWRTTTQRLGADLGLDWPVDLATAATQVASFLNVGMPRSHLDVLPSLPSADRRIASLATTVFAYAQACAAGGRIPVPCWEATGDDLRTQLSDGLVAESLAIDPEQTAARVQASGLGLWEPVEILSEILQTRLYFRAHDEPAHESRHVAAVVSTSDNPMHVSFALPTNARVDHIRFDPAMRSGVFRIHSITINGYALSPADLTVSATSQRALPSDGALFAFFSEDDDPYFELDLRELACAINGVQHIALAFQCDSLFDRLGREIGADVGALSNRVGVLQQALESTRAGQAASLAALKTLIAETHAQKRTTRQALQCALASAGWDVNDSPEPHTRTTALRARIVRLRPRSHDELQYLAMSKDGPEVWWRSRNADAFFSLQLPDNQYLPSGRYELHMALAGGGSQPLHPWIGLGLESAAQDCERIEFVVSPSGIARALLRCRQPVHALRLYPGAAPGTMLRFSPPTLRRLRGLESLLRATRLDRG